MEPKKKHLIVVIFFYEVAKSQIKSTEHNLIMLSIYNLQNIQSHASPGNRGGPRPHGHRSEGPRADSKAPEDTSRSEQSQGAD